MKKRRIGKSGIVVSEIGLGTMTFGSSSEKDESFRIMDYALDHGIDFFDTAEIYPVPPREAYVHRTEEWIGEWLKTRSRDKIILASKVAGPGHGWFKPPVRSGITSLDRHHIRIAIEGSLRRLGTDYIDLYQIHWPDPSHEYSETLDALEELKKEGKIRIAGTSNDTAYGLTKSLWTAEKRGTLRFESIQNNYGILNRRYEDELAFVSKKEEVSLLAYSPLAGGVATGKYNTGRPENARFTKYLSDDGERQRKMAHRFLNEKTLETVRQLMPLAEELGVSVGVLSLAWSRQNAFTASTLVGANSVQQLSEMIPAAALEIPSAILKKIDEITNSVLYPMG